MAIATFILGHSGSGKSYSLKNLDPELVDMINVMGKPLPFRGGNKINSYANDNPIAIVAALKKTKKPIVIIDDFQYTMANEFMRRSHEKGFDKFTDIGRNAWNILTTATREMLPYQRVYILSHTQDTDTGGTKMKTVGKLLDEKITPEGMVTIVLQTKVEDGQHYFTTQNNGHNTVKSPEGMFDSDLIPNDLNAVDDAVCAYYEINKTGEQS